MSSFLTNLLGARLVCIVGSLIGCAGVILSMFANSVYALYVTFGFIAGKGTFVIYLNIKSYYERTKKNYLIGTYYFFYHGMKFFQRLIQWCD